MAHNSFPSFSERSFDGSLHDQESNGRRVIAH